jgi:hypothetical protein
MKKHVLKKKHQIEKESQRRLHNSFGPCENVFLFVLGVDFWIFFQEKYVFDTCKGFLWRKGPNLPDFEIFKKKKSLDS